LIKARRVVALAAVGIAGFVASADAQSAGATTLATFTTPGTYTWTVPTGVTSVTFDVYGARGGGVNEFIGGVLNVITSGGTGGEATGKFVVHAGEVFEVVVGGQGGSATVDGATGAAGFNGGGAGDPTGGTYVSGGGGGGSDVRIGGRGDPCASVKTCGYPDRIVVGGGGGGGSNDSNYPGLAGGGLAGTSPCSTGGGVSGVSGAQECGGKSVCQGNAGRFGLGAKACADRVTDPNAGAYGAGGGGWYGGGSYVYGGGGSGYISPFAKSGSFPGGTSVGDGKVIITT
jgi:hypothetical protein